MFDIRNERVCDHKIFDETLTLQGASPNYFALLRFGSNLNTNVMEIRDFSATNGLTSYSYTLNGFTNWSLNSSGTQVNFNSLGLGGPGTGVASFADGSTQINPPHVYMATYLSLPQNCPLHNQTNPSDPAFQFGNVPVQKDINITPQGGFDTVTGHDKVRQAVLKALLTLQQSNPFVPGYGSTVSGTIGQKFTLYTQFTLQQSIQNAVNFLISQQQIQPAIPLSETIFRVASVNLGTDPADPRAVKVTINITVGDYTTVPIVFSLLTAA